MLGLVSREEHLNHCLNRPSLVIGTCLLKLEKCQNDSSQAALPAKYAELSWR